MCENCARMQELFDRHLPSALAELYWCKNTLIDASDEFMYYIKRIEELTLENERLNRELDGVYYCNLMNDRLKE